MKFELKNIPECEELIGIMTHRFVLTGSRSMVYKGFNGVKEDTDWDFVAREGDPYIDTLIQEFGYLHHSSSINKEYLDAYTVAIHKFGPEGKIQLIEKRLTAFYPYIRAFTKMSAAFYENYIWKGNGHFHDNIRRNVEMLVEYEMDKQA